MVLFFGASNLTVPATDAPDLSGVTSLYRMFYSANSFNQPIDHWDVSNVTNMIDIFNASAFNRPLGNWSTASVTKMTAMFQSSPFNQPIDSWDVSSVDDTYGMFRYNHAFNQPLNSWDVSKVIRAYGMFLDATAFNQPLDSWDTSSMLSMTSMFQGATSFDQDLSSWDMSSIITPGVWWNNSFYGMFKHAKLSPQNLDSTLISFLEQASATGKVNFKFHIGAKTYTSVGEASLNTMRNTYNWTITEQYLLQYDTAPGATIFGDSTQQVDSAADGTAIEAIPSKHYSFVAWSDGVTDNPRTDLSNTDNLTVYPIMKKSGSGTSAKTQVKKLTEYGNEEQAEEIEEKFLDKEDENQNTTPATLTESLNLVKALPDTLPKNLDPVKDRDTIVNLIKVLTELIQVLMLLMVGLESEA